MGISVEDMKYEKKRLDRVIAEVKRQLGKNRDSYNNYRKEIVEIQENMGGEISLVGGDLDDIATIWQYQTDIDRHGIKLKHASKQVKRLLRILDSPYFGRMDFCEHGEVGEEKIYIGISNLVDENSGKYLIYDWRAPISGMFYDFEKGKAFYECPAGTIRGEILLKRQYRIRNGQLVFAIESSIKIDDEILQEILARSADSRMNTIVTSIQKQQNRIIRNEKEKALVVTGPAGSGKTSVALHRAAFLLYRYRDSIKPEDIVIYSPNRVFSDYISNVLPELGEDNVKRITFNELASDILGKGYELESPNRLMEHLLGDKGRTPGMDEIKYRCSGRFLDKIHEHVKYLETEGFKFSNIYFNNELIVTAEELEEQFYKEMDFLPVVKRLKKIKGRILYLLKEPERERSMEIREALNKTGNYFLKEELRSECIRIVKKELEPVNRLIDEMTTYSFIDAYRDITGRILPGVETTDKKRPEYVALRYEDIAPLVLLKVMLEGISCDARHIIVDELQDYSLVQMEVLRKFYPNARFTMLGDSNQLINPLTGNADMNNLKKLLNIGESSGIISLNKTYRSTKEIAGFCNAIVNADIEPVERKGRNPVVETRLCKNVMMERIVNGIEEAREEGYVSIAVICRTACQAREVFDCLFPCTDVRLLRGEDDEFVAGTVVLPSYLAKGLEFDVVFAVCKEGDYDSTLERNLLYTVCTRALHMLNLYCEKEPPRYIMA